MSKSLLTPSQKRLIARNRARAKWIESINTPITNLILGRGAKISESGYWSTSRREHELKEFDGFSFHMVSRGALITSGTVKVWRSPTRKGAKPTLEFDWWETASMICGTTRIVRHFSVRRWGGLDRWKRALSAVLRANERARNGGTTKKARAA